LKFKGNAIKNVKIFSVLVDCNVTEFDVETATKPCFPLKKIWWYTLISVIAQMVDIGGACEGFVVVVQQDNAVEQGCSTWIHEQFNELGWLY
jgi:hypothetical protein